MPVTSKQQVPRRLYREPEKGEKRKNYEQEIDKESSLILSRTRKTDTPVSLQKPVARLEKIEITMTLKNYVTVELCRLFGGG